MVAQEDPVAAVIDFAVIGGQKAGSTFLHRCLSAHPQVEMPHGESRHFEDPYCRESAVQQLEVLFANTGDTVRRGIKRPDYLARPLVADRLADVCPDLKLVVVLREPIARGVSAYFDYVRLGFAPLLPLDEAFEGILSGSLQQSYPRLADILDFGMYGRHLSRYLEFFPRSHLHILLHEDLSEYPQRELKALYRFLAIDEEFEPYQQSRYFNTGVYSPRRLRLLRSRNRFQFSYASDLSRRVYMKPQLPGRAWIATATALDRIVLSPFDRQSAPHPSMAVQNKLWARYADDVTVVEKLVGRSLSGWKPDAV